MSNRRSLTRDRRNHNLKRLGIESLLWLGLPAGLAAVGGGVGYELGATPEEVALSIESGYIQNVSKPLMASAGAATGYGLGLLGSSLSHNYLQDKLDKERDDINEFHGGLWY